MMERKDEGLGFLLQYQNIAWYEDGCVRILDRRIFPVEVKFVECRRHEEVAKAIYDMVTQSGGPYVAAAMGMSLAAKEAEDLGEEAFRAYMEKAAYTLSHARPTTVTNMVKVTDGSLKAMDAALKSGKSVKEMPETLRDYALGFLNENVEECDRVAFYLADKVPHNGTIMTQCYAETVIGTLLRELRKRGNTGVKMVCPETRPYYQGARLTASLCCSMGFDTTVITDNMPGYALNQLNVDLFTSAADMICVDGHVVNKVGTFQIANMAHYWGIPYYTTGNPTAAHPTIDTVKIEMRDPELVLESMGYKHTMEGVKGWYPAFDITPPKLISGIATDKGIYSPYNLQRYFTDPFQELK